MRNWFNRPLTGKHVLAWLLGFFAVVFVANGAFVYFAQKSWTGIVTDDAYRKGLHYNDTLASAEAQHELGWIAELTLIPRDDGRYRLIATFADREDAPVSGLSVDAYFRRPAVEALDQSVMLESIGEGRYAADLTLPDHGQWDVTVEANGLEEEHFVVEKRLFVK